MKVECIKEFGQAVPGDVAEVPDGASVDPVHWRVLDGPPPPPPAAPALPAVTPLKEGMLWLPRPA